MRRIRLIIISLVLLLVVAGCGFGIWNATQPAMGRFLMPGSLDVQVAELGFGKRLITYRMANPGDGWLTTIGRHLQDEGWTPPNEYYVWGSTENFANIYTRRFDLGQLTMWEQARLDGNARFARITLRRWVEWNE